MKKKLLYALTLLAVVAACSKEVINEEYNSQAPVQQLTEDGTLVELNARIAPSTKVNFDSDQGRFSWAEMGDEISVHVTNGTRLVEGEEVVMSPAAYRKGVVAPPAESGIVLDDDQNEVRKFYFVMSEGQQRDYYAVYPASVVDEDNYGNPDLKINLPASYEISPEGMGNYSPTPMIAVNDPSSNDLDFRHVGGLLRLQLYDVSPATASFEVSLGKRITGSFAVKDFEDPSTAVPYIATDDAADAVTFTFTEPLTEYKDGLVINVPVPTGIYESLTVTAKDAGGNSIFSYEDSKRRMFDSSRGRKQQAIVSAVAIPLCLEAVDDGAVIFNNPQGLTIEYSYDNIFWTAASDATVTIPASAGTCVYLRGDNESYAGGGNIEDYTDEELMAFIIGLLYSSSEPTYSRISTDGPFYIFGNIMSLVDKLHFAERTDLRGMATFTGLFSGAENLYNHPSKGLELPATTLTLFCYMGLFSGCSNITRVSALPATILQPYCYATMYQATGVERGAEIPAEQIPDVACAAMYENCASLTFAPDFKASVVGDNAFGSMFKGCINLVSAPALPASEVGDSGYEAMFTNCISMVTPPTIGATTIGKEAFYSMFKGCAALTSAPSLSAITTLPYEACRSMFSGCISLTAPPEMAATTLGESACQEMFMNCNALTTAPSLPAMTIPKYAYQSMFRGCVSLEEAPELPATSVAELSYAMMFYDCSSLTTASALPATAIGESAYSNMFYRCTALEEPPVISATTLATSCCSQMFYGCTSLLEAPELPATELVESCYSSMFYGCTSLTRSPALPATTVANLSCNQMFYGCTSLTEAPALPATTLATNCYREMFRGCTSLQEAPVLPATSLEGCGQCYYYMFNGCSSLRYVKMLSLTPLVKSTGWATLGYDYSTSWLAGVASGGTFVANKDATWTNFTSNRNGSWIPSGWTILFDE